MEESFSNFFFNFFSISFHSTLNQSFYNPYNNPPLPRPPQFDQFSFITFASSVLAFAFAPICCNFVRCGAFPSVSANLMASPSSLPLPLSHSPLLHPSSSQSSRHAFIHLCKQWARLFHLLRHEQNKKANATMIQKWQKILQIKKVKEKERDGERERASKRKRKLKISSFLASEWAVNPISSAIFTCQVAVAVDVATSAAQLAAQSTSQLASNSIVAGAVASAWHWMAIESGT